MTNFGGSHLEQPTGSVKTVFLLGSEICAETENFLRQSDGVAHLRTIYFALYKFTHYSRGEAEWLASPDWDRKVVGSNPGVARSLLLLVCVSFTIIGQPRNSVLIRRV